VISTSSTTGNITIQNTSTGLINIGNDSGTGAISIGSSSGPRAINIGSSTGGSPGTISIGTWTSATTNTGQTINIGQSTQTGSIIVDTRSTTVNIAAASGGPYHTKTVNIGGTINIGNDTQTGTISIASSTGARQVDIGTGAATQTLNFGTGAGVKTISVGSTNTTSATTLQSGTGAMTLNAGGICDVNAVGAVTIDSSGAAISIGADSVSQAINIGTAGTRTVTIGNASATLTFSSGGTPILVDSSSTSSRGIGNSVFNNTASAIASGSVLALQYNVSGQTPRVVLASANAANVVERYPMGIAGSILSASTSGRATMAHGLIAMVLLDTAPAQTDVGKPVYVSTTAGSVSLTAPSGSGQTVYRVGFLQYNVASSGLYRILYAPQFIADIP